MSEALAQKNKRLALKLLLMVGVMIGVGVSLIPMYRAYTDASGVNGKLEPTSESVIQQLKIDQSRLIRLDLITSIAKDTPLKFEALTKQMQVYPGQVYEAEYRVTNLGQKPLRVHANPSVTPGMAVQKVKLIKCFCFEIQQFAVNETKQLSIRFAIDPSLGAKYHAIVLAQQFFITP